MLDLIIFVSIVFVVIIIAFVIYIVSSINNLNKKISCLSDSYADYWTVQSILKQIEFLEKRIKDLQLLYKYFNLHIVENNERYFEKEDKC